MKFTELTISDSLKEAVHYMGFENCTPIQSEAIPIILENKDLIGCAQTGTGKTAAFLIPLLEKISQSTTSGTQALIVVPTRELAMQIDEQVQGIGYFAGIESIPIYGGGEGKVFAQQKKAIQSGAQILIATPGRLLAHMNLGYVDLSKLHMLILDEADRMLDMGFIDDIKKIIDSCPKKRQTLMFSATMAKPIRQLANEILHDPHQINLAIAKPAAGVTQKIYSVYDNNKPALLEHILSGEEIQNMIIFSSRKETVDAVERQLRHLKYACRALHSGREQSERQERLREFKAGKIQILVATDVLSRGIDISGLSHVLNYDMPPDPADYVHRVGRTARADKKGTAISFVNPKDQYALVQIEALIGSDLQRNDTPKEIGDTPEFNPSKKGKPNRGNSNQGKGKRPFHKKRRPQGGKKRDGKKPQ